jgi:CRP-like cAMP-binding protein
MDFDIFLESVPTNCNKIQEKYFNKGDTITTYIEKRNQICILTSGEADLIRYDFNGNKTIIRHLSTHDIFGETLYPAKTNNELFVIAKKKCRVIFFTYDIIFTKCKQNCKFHTTLRENITNLILQEIIEQNTRIEVLTQKTIRDKLLSYFKILSAHGLRKTFSLPFSKTDLADFLSVDRSAMTRELSNLQKEGFIEINGNTVKLMMN